VPSPTADSPQAKPWVGHLTLTPGMVIYTGPGGDAGHHSHHAIQLIRSLDAPFELIVEGEASRCRAALIPSGLPHSFSCGGSKLFIALIEPLGPRGVGLNSLASNPGRRCLDDRLPPLSQTDISDPIQMAGHMLGTLLPDLPTYPTLSPHVAAALAYLDEAIEGKPRLEEAALLAGISPSRLTHLFTEEVGIPFRNFILWLRLRRVVDEVSQGANLTEAAFAAGFSDSPHLSKAFREHFGISPSALLGMTLAAETWPSSHLARRSADKYKAYPFSPP
jgi:AraC-like DNA-binding protein